MAQLCPYCFYQNEPGTGKTCARCLQDLTDIPCCDNCGATQLAFARYCYHCGLRLSPKPTGNLPSASSRKYSIDSSTTVGRGNETKQAGEADCRKTLFQQESLQLLHLQTGTLIALPAHISPIVIGKAGTESCPDIDVQDFPHSEVVSRQQASLRVVHTECAIADLNSTNGTYVNDVQLPVGHQQPLEFGDRINFGQSEKFTFLFIRELPINLKHLQAISGGDVAFEQEILRTYEQRAHHSLEQMKTAITQQDEVVLASVAEDLALASHNVGAQVVHLLASQLHAIAHHHSAISHRQLLKVIEEALQKVRFFTKAYS